MATFKTTPGKPYAITTDGAQKVIFAQSGEMTIADGEILTAIEGKPKFLSLLNFGSGLPTGYTRLAYLESTGSQTIGVPFDSKYKNFETIHDIGLPSTTTGLYVYGGTSVSAGYGPRYYAEHQALSFSNASIRYSGYARGSRHILGWLGVYSGSGSPTFSLRADGVEKETIAGFYNQFWPTAYNVFSSTRYEASIGGRTYSLKIKIESEHNADYVPCIDPQGVPCLYERMGKSSHYNDGAGEFIAGIDTTAQIKTLLRNLPDLTGQASKSLQIRLAAELQNDEIRAAIDASALAKNWEITEAV